MPEVGLSTTVAGVVVWSSGGAFNVSALPANLNGGSYRFRVFNAYGDGAYTPSFQISPWILMEMQSPAEGTRVEVNATIPLSWSSALWAFEASAYLLPSFQNRVLSWDGVLLGKFSVSTAAGSAWSSLFIPNDTTPGDFVIQLVDEAKAERSCQLSRFFRVIPQVYPSAPVVLSASFNATSAFFEFLVSFALEQNVSTIEATCKEHGNLRVHSASVPTSDSQANRVEIWVRIAPSHEANRSLACFATAVSKLDRRNSTEPFPLDILAVPPAAPAVISATAPNASLALFRVAFAAGQNVSSVAVACAGFGGPYSVSANASDADASGTDVRVDLAVSYASDHTLACSVYVASTAGLESEAAKRLVAVPAEAPAPPRIASAFAVNSTLLELRMAFVVNQSVTAIEATCTDRNGLYVKSAEAREDIGEVVLSLQVAIAYTNYTVACTAAATSASGLRSASEAAMVNVPAAPPAAPAVVSATAPNASLALFRVAFAAGQNVSSVAVACAGFGGPYSASANASDADASGTDVRVDLAVSYASDHTLACSVYVASTAGLESEAAKRLVAVPAEAPAPPRIASAFAVNSTLLELRTAFAANQSVTAIEATCTDRNGLYVKSAEAREDIGEVVLSLQVAIAYTNYTVACTAAATSASGLRSASEAAMVNVPAAPPAAPAVISAAAPNASLALFRVAFAAGQNVSSVTVECAGFGGPYSVSANASDADASGTDVRVDLAVSYASDHTLACSVYVSSTAGLRSGSIANSLPFFAEPPSPPSAVSGEALNATLVRVRGTFAANQNVSAVDFSCVGRGVPYADAATVSDADAAAFAVLLPVSPSFSSNYTLVCALRTVAVAGKQSDAVQLAVQVPAAAPWPPLSATLAVIHESAVGAAVDFARNQSASAIEYACAGLGGPYAGSLGAHESTSLQTFDRVSFNISVRSFFNASYPLDCAFSVRATSSLISSSTPASIAVPTATPWSPSITSLVVGNATEIAFTVGFTQGQSVDRAQVQCTGRGGQYVAEGTAPIFDPASESVRGSMQVAMSEATAGRYVLTCQASVRSSGGKSSTWSAPAAVTVPGVFSMAATELRRPDRLISAGVLSLVGASSVFRSPSGRSMVAFFGAQQSNPSTESESAIYVYDKELQEWTEAAVRAPMRAQGLKCGWDSFQTIFCTGGYTGSAESTVASSDVWAYSVALDARLNLPSMPVTRANHCFAVFNRTLWIAGGIGADVGSAVAAVPRNDLLSLAVSSSRTEWRTEIAQGNLGMPPLANPSCARIDARWFIVGTPDGANTVTLHEVDLGGSAAGRRSYRLVGAVPSAPSAAFGLGSCHGFLFAAFADSTLLFLGAQDASVELERALQLPSVGPLVSPFLDADCETCTSILYGVSGSTGATPTSRFFSMTGTVPIPAANCTYPATAELPAVPFSSIFGTIPVASQPPAPTVPPPAPPRTPTPSPYGPPTTPSPTTPTAPTPSPDPVAVSFWLSVQATQEECASYLQRYDAASVSTRFSRLVFASLSVRADAEEGRLRITDVRCGSVLFRVEVLRASAGPTVSPVSDLFIVESVGNLTRGGRLVMPELEDRPVSSMFNASFAPGVPASGPIAGALARGEAITIDLANPAPTPPPASGGGPIASGASAAAAAEGAPSDSGGPGTPVGALAGAVAAAGALFIALGGGLYIVKRRRRRAYSAGVNTGRAPLDLDPELPFTDYYASDNEFQSPTLLQTTTTFDPLTNGNATTTWIDFPALSDRELDLLRLVGVETARKAGKAGVATAGLTLAQRAAISPPKPIPPELLDCVQEPLAMLGEGAFGRVYAVSIPRSLATWLPCSGEDELACGTSTGEMVTLKRAVKEVALSDRDVAAREIHGARLQMLCDHPNVLRCEAIFADRFKLYVVLPLADVSLSSLLANRGVLPSDLIASFAFQIASGMAYLHHELARPVAHRDLKPQNVLVFREEDGAPPTLRLCDFGISRHVETAKSLRGTLVYLPPEVYSKDHTATKADVWAFGIILMEMSTGSKPFGGTMIGPEELTRGQPYPRAAFAAVPEPLRPLARSCLEKKPTQRPTFLEIRDSLGRLLAPSQPNPAAVAGADAHLRVAAPAPSPRLAPAPAAVEAEVAPEARGSAPSLGQERTRGQSPSAAFAELERDNDVRAIVVQVD
eukprot:tig00020944_g16369.t1